MIKNNDLITYSLFVVLSIHIISCASGAKIDQMVVPHSEASFLGAEGKLKENVIVSEVSGGKETNPLWTSQIGNTEFKAALIESLKQTGYLGNNQSDYQLTASLLEVDQPFGGFNLTVKTTVLYKLIEKSTSKQILMENITASYTAGMGDSAIAVKRLRLANEGSARTNILEFIKILHNLDINNNQISVE